MPYKARWSIPIPECSLPTFLFTSPTTDLSERECFIDANQPSTHYLTRNAFRVWSQRLAVGLRKSPNFKEGDRILVFSSNTLFFPVVFMGTVMAGGIFTGANPTFTARELAYQWKDSGATYLLCVDGAIDVGIEAAELAGMDKSKIFVFNSALIEGPNVKGTETIKGCKYWGGLVADETEARSFQWNDLKGPGECHRTIALNYSSGTTGFPKGVEVTHKNYISNVIQHNHLPSLRPDFKERESRQKWLLYLPLYHAMGQTIFIAGSLMRNIPVYIMPKFDFLQVLENVQKFRITELSLVPPIAVALAKHPAVKQFDLSSVMAIGCGAAPLGQDIAQQVEAIWDGRMNLKQGYGMTEVTCSLLGWDPTLHSSSFAVGEPNANCEAKLMNATEENAENFIEVTERGPEHTGELWVRGPNIMKGYWRNEKATKETFSSDSERWLRTGDVAYVDEKGMFFIVDRIKELIKVKGNQVAPAELEALLLEHPAVADVAVIGIQTADGDEAPRAYIVRQPGSESKITEKDLQDFVKSKVVKYKQLAGGVEWIDAVPKNPSGKILRKVLREQWKTQQGGSTGRTKL